MFEVLPVDVDPRLLMLLMAAWAPALAFLFGALWGSFANVVIYRVPLGLSVNEPKRSFCPNCKTQIPAWLNIDRR